MVVLDAVLTGAKGLNLWSSFRTPPPQRSARLYRALVDTGLASSVSGGIVPTADPFLYTISLTATDGTSLDRLEEAALAELDRLKSGHLNDAEVQRAARQLRARLVFENDCITNIAHQLGYFQTIGSWRTVEMLRDRIDAVTTVQVAAAAARRLTAAKRTVGRFEPVPAAG
jgi:zinc protease